MIDTMTDADDNARHAAHVQASAEYVAQNPDWSPWRGEGTAEASESHKAYEAYVEARVPQILDAQARMRVFQIIGSDIYPEAPAAFTGDWHEALRKTAARWAPAA
ncbi:hypothetical protein [Streptomyces olivochromogenes]|uniref:Uncharacterized protein n=1 Tax=Streptomyces olivochromogenes TaxID=1963 RepID=A0A250VT70_STROL|nr:hypothetical protein [Streptomyces olivochromogenes]KUN38264.1 hypothetical protein AQJ27_45005 [Streptomyces olivochromogenes]GAX57294.1 hypothetical protein SO3561_08864 [Streptomyces olivochromogenes]